MEIPSECFVNRSKNRSLSRWKEGKVGNGERFSIHHPNCKRLFTISRTKAPFASSKKVQKEFRNVDHLEVHSRRLHSQRPGTTKLRTLVWQLTWKFVILRGRLLAKSHKSFFASNKLSSKAEEICDFTRLFSHKSLRSWELHVISDFTYRLPIEQM